MNTILIPTQKYTITIDNEPLYLEYLRRYRDDFAFTNLLNGEIVLLKNTDIPMLNRRIEDNDEIFTVKSDVLECVVGREEMKEDYNKFDSNAVFINIYTPGQNPLNIDKYFHDQLSVPFYDIVPIAGENIVGSAQPISKATAKKIKDFIIKHVDKKFAINCDAGMSRSAGVAMAVECLVKHNGDAYAYATSFSDLKEHPRYAPNLFVYKSIIDS